MSVPYRRHGCVPGTAHLKKSGARMDQFDEPEQKIFQEQSIHELEYKLKTAESRAKSEQEQRGLAEVRVKEYREALHKSKYQSDKLTGQVTSLERKVASVTKQKDDKEKRNRSLEKSVESLERKVKSLEKKAELRLEDIEMEFFARRVPDMFAKDVLRYNKPKGLFTKIIAEQPGSEAALVSQAGIVFIHLANGEDDKVIAEYDKLIAGYKGLEKYGHHTYIIPQEYYHRGERSARLGLKDKALAQYQMANKLWEKVDLNDLNAFLGGATLFTLGRGHISVNEKARGIEYLKELTRDYPESDYAAWAHYSIWRDAKSLKRRGELAAEKADELMEKHLVAIVDNHQDRSYYSPSLKELAMFYFNKEQYAKALKRFEQLIEKNPKDLDRYKVMMSECRERLAS